MKKNVSLLNGNLFKSIFIFSLPLIISNLLQSLFNMCDVAVIGKFSGSDSLGAVGSTTMLISFFTSFVIGLANGVNVHVARFLGSNEKEKMDRCIHTSFFVCLIGGFILMLIGMSGAKGILLLLQTKDELIDKALLYLLIYFSGMPALGLYNYGQAVYSALGETKKPLYFLAAGGILNVILNLTTVIALKMDVAGVALASSVSQYFSGILIVLSLRKDKLFYFSKLSIDKKLMQDVLKIGLPTGLQNSVFAIANMFIQSAVNSLTTVEVEANAAAANADTLVWGIMSAFYVACSSFMSANYGAGDKKRVRDSYLITTMYSVLIALFFGLIILAFGRQFESLFTNDEEVVEAGLTRLKIMSLSYFLSGFMDNTDAACRGLSKTLVPTILVILGSCIFRIAWIYTVFAHYKTMASLYLLYSASWTLTALAVIPYFIVIYKKMMKQIPSV